MIAREFLYSETLKKNLRLKSSSLRKKQMKKLRRILKIAYENVPLYHRKYKAASIHPDDIITLDDLAKVPPVTKSEIQLSPMQNMIARKANASRLTWRSTSGSTGTPLNIALNKRTVELEGAIWYRSLSENGFRFRDKTSIICDPRSFPKSRRLIESLGIIKRQYLSIFDSAETQLTHLEQFKPDVIKAYPSSLSILADYSKQRASSLKPRIVFTSAEILDRQSREFINSAFGTEIFDNYSSNEFALMAWECSKHNGYHINLDSILMEFVEDEETVAFGERGEILCTGILNEIMPLIRYKIGDVGIPIKDECSCGRTLPLMKMVEGRADDFLITTDGQIISPTVFFPYPFTNFDEIRQFRVIQEKREHVVIQVIPRNGLHNKQQILQEAENNIKRLFGEQMQVEFQVLDKIERDSTGKFRKIVSNIPIENYTWNHYN